MTEVIKVEDYGSNIGNYNIPIYNAIIIPRNATNGDMIKAMFPDAQIDYHEESDLDYITVFTKDCDTCQDYSYEWWDAPYKAESEVKE